MPKSERRSWACPVCRTVIREADVPFSAPPVCSRTGACRRGGPCVELTQATPKK